MATFSFELVSPERVLFSGEATSVVVPGSEGEMTVLANHAPVMTALRPGIVTVDGARRLFVRGGFADITPAGLTLLAEQAVPVEEIDVEKVAADIRNAQEDLRDARTEEVRKAAEARLEALTAMAAAAGH